MKSRPGGVTIQVRVRDYAGGVSWYERLLGRPPDFVPHGGFGEWELVPDCWLQLAEGEPASGSGPIRLGVDDLDAERTRVETELGVVVDESLSGRLDDIVRWCTFTDPFGNRVGFFEDLERWQAAREARS